MSVGRPRSFCVDQALDKALKVFWRKGYEGTSLDDLTEAMGINRPSLYSAFGNKEALFRKSVERYESLMAERIHQALDEPSLPAAIEKLLRGNIEIFTDPKNPRGCFIVQGALACGDAADELKEEMAQRRATFTALLRKRVTLAIQQGELSSDVNTSDLARYLAALSHGIAVQAADGASRAELMRVVKVGLAALPVGKRERKRPNAGRV